MLSLNYGGFWFRAAMTSYCCASEPITFSHPTTQMETELSHSFLRIQKATHSYRKTKVEERNEHGKPGLYAPGFG